VFSVWARLREETEADDGSPDAKVELLKQRNGEAQHRAMYLWFEPRSLQYCITNKRRAVQYMPAEQAEPVR
jgi:twinkle protein